MVKENKTLQLLWNIKLKISNMQNKYGNKKLYL